ncbi:MAG: flagellar biosynthesis protein FlhB [Gammaproteobacteria bacterium]|nr:flagellar biosynthesis protein FlhB [Gammaproteobacteria bacterium]
MSESESGQERTEEPTSKRLDDARNEGNIARSKELNTMMVVTGGAVILWTLGPSLTTQFISLLKGSFKISRETIFNENAMLLTFTDMLVNTLIIFSPLMLAMVVLAIGAPLMLGGWSFSTDALMPKFSRLSPLQGFKRMFGLNGVVDLVKSLLKFALLSIITLIVLHNNFDKAVIMGTANDSEVIGDSMQLIISSTVFLSLALIVIAAIDVPYQLWDHLRKLRMTRQELRDEMKQTEGNPEIRGRIRQAQREIAKRRMLADIPKANVILMNPTHFAVALQYDQDKHVAPVMLAKGTDQLAFKIREIAQKHKIPIYEEPRLTRAIYYNTDPGELIPKPLYVAVAQVLAYILRLQRVRREGGLWPNKPVIQDIPDDLTKPIYERTVKA